MVKFSFDKLDLLNKVKSFKNIIMDKHKQATFKVASEILILRFLSF